MFIFIFRIIRYPFDGNLRKRKTVLFLIVIPLFSIAASIPAIYNVKYRYYPGKHVWVCEYVITKTSYLWNTISSVIIFIPIISLMTIYVRAAKALVINGIDSNNLAIKRRNAVNKKVIKLFTVIVCIFALLTIPSAALSILFNICVYNGIIKSNSVITAFGIILHILVVLLIFNYCVNPLIYRKMHKDVSRCVSDLERRILNKFSCFCRMVSNE